ncbi:MAG: bifunctional hydroxymethylpyrimidine kinase/phosphomethylpyrimidine kinase [Acidimicrobiales bacterium]|nr:bifunctional hydroxymethylpyrimidine kinase/phosphomethylpyrimidine kinase [Hyphomonadaceae bacterium]RZV43668.1 MAG: bifunctional hydroxymethylpyrimidine kinase/phosphomethylpyrimidine kinase [Acidimicrobiales bacterium]
MSDKVGRVLVVAGSDSGGGAGIQADIKTCTAFGVYSATAITAITAQNTTGVQRSEALAPDLVADQMRSVLSDIGADVIKIGMLANAEIINAVADIIAKDAEDISVVLDPVLAATSGDPLLEGSAIEVLKEKLMPLADIVTPNTHEAALLTGLKIESAEDMIKAGDELIKMGAYAALMKGGHLEGKSVTDILVSEEGNQMMNAPRIHSRHTHGTGCTLASAVASMMAQGAPLEIAVMEAREFVFEAIRSAPKLGKGNGPLNHGLKFPDEPTQPSDKPNPFAALKDLQ